MSSQGKSIQIRSLRALMLGSVSLSMMLASTSVMAQTTDSIPEVQQIPEAAPDEVVTSGIRRTIQDAISLKRDATTVVDGLSADEIGDLPALSIAEALEQITSVGAQREGSGATEVSIRGLGPFLGSTVINGREATNGSGDRSVNFSQFPSELFNKIEVHKTQSAELIEGGVAGQIALSTLKPLEFGKRRFQVQAKGSIQPDNLRLNQREQTFGYRLTGSYVDQWESDIGDFGLSLGGQIQRRPNSEQEARSSSTFDACRISSLDSSSCDDGETDPPFLFIPDPALSDAENQANFDSAANAFSDSNQNQSAQIISPFTGQPFGVDEDFLLTTSGRSFRQNITDDSRDAVFAAGQWRPSDRLEINADIQYSTRTFTEFRNEIEFDANDIEPIGGSNVIPGFELEITENGALRQATTTGEIQLRTQFNERSEDYVGFGGNVSFDATDRLNLTVDASYSDTSRREAQFRGRIATPSMPVGISIFGDGGQGVQFTLENTDINDLSLFNNDNAEVQEDLNQFRNHTIFGLRGDAVYDLDNGLFSTLKVGARYSVQEYDQLPRIRNEVEVDDGSDFANGEFVSEIDGVIIQDFGSTSNIGPLAAQACLNGSFPDSAFLDGEINGNLITNIDSNGNIIAAGTGNAFPTFSGNCLAETLVGRSLVVPDISEANGEALAALVDVEEETIALYGQVDFNTELSNIPVRGNFGVRYVNTSLESNSFRTSFSATVNAEGFLEDITSDESAGALVPGFDEFSYSEFLPSFNFVADVKDDVLVRGGIFRALSRPDFSDLGNGRFIDLNLINDDDDDQVTLADFAGAVVANGNPTLEPFTSWNFDIAAEWYPNEDSILGVGFYFKDFTGGFQNSLVSETFTVTGQGIDEDDSELDVLVPILTTSDETNTIWGVEFNAAHAFDYLPGLLSGTGFKLSYNFADSNFEFEDGRLGEAVTLDDAGNIISVREGLIPPANISGFSRHTANGQVYWSIGKTTLTGIGKYRSSFFQQFIGTPLNLRFIDEAFVLDARLKHKINSNLEISLEGTNLLNTAREQFNPTLDSFAEINVFGPRVFLGLRAKF